MVQRGWEAWDVYFTRVFRSVLTVSPGLWLAIGIELNVPGECNSKSLHNRSNICASLPWCQAGVGAFEVTLATRALAGLENLQLLGFQDRNIKSLISVF